MENNYKNPALAPEQRADDLLARMTLEEKIHQLIQVPIGKDSNPNNIGTGENEFDPTVGSILAFAEGVHVRNEYQRTAVEKTRLGIPILWGHDVIHGWDVVFPTGLAQACSFHPELTERASSALAHLSHYLEGLNWTFAPMVEVSHDPRWGRVSEGYGEDPYTASQFAAAAVRGYQGKDPAEPGNIAACLKHYVGYSHSEAGGDYAYTDLSERALWEWYLPPFESGVKAGAMTVMSSFNDITGTPSVCNRHYLTEVLRGKWGFSGFVVSDWDGVKQLEYQGYSADPTVQCAASLRAGNDMNMADKVYLHAEDALRKGLITQEEVDLAVRRILLVKFRLGLFEHPYIEELPKDKIIRKEYFDLSLEFARECAVLLKNENHLLPLKPETWKRKKIALIGPAVNDAMTHAGAWSGLRVIPPKTYQEVVCDFLPEAEIMAVRGCGFDSEPSDGEGIASAVTVAKNADLVILTVGENGFRTGENKSYGNISLPGRQIELIRAVAQTGKPVIMLTTSGRPLTCYEEIGDCADAILHLWQGGYHAATAAFEILTGAYNPNGKLAMTFPRSVAQIPLYYNHHRNSRPFNEPYKDMESTPSYPFGFGLSYSNFVYGPLRMEGETVLFELTNDSEIGGKEVVIWYLSDPEATFTQPVERVIGFEKIELAPHETRTVRLELDRMRDLAYVLPDGTKRFEPGLFVLSASRRSSLEFNLR